MITPDNREEKIVTRILEIANKLYNKQTTPASYIKVSEDFIKHYSENYNISPEKLKEIIEDWAEAENKKKNI